MGCCQVCSSCTQQFCDANVILCPCQTAFLPAQTDVGALLLGSVQSCILIPNGCPTCHHFSSSCSLKCLYQFSLQHVLLTITNQGTSLFGNCLSPQGLGSYKKLSSQGKKSELLIHNAKLTF